MHSEMCSFYFKSELIVTPTIFTLFEILERDHDTDERRKLHLAFWTSISEFKYCGWVT